MFPVSRKCAGSGPYVTEKCHRNCRGKGLAAEKIYDRMAGGCEVGTKGRENMYCRKCGAVVPDGKKFCADCGEPVEQAAAGQTGKLSKEQRDALTKKIEQEKGALKVGIPVMIFLYLLSIISANLITSGITVVKACDRRPPMSALLEYALPGIGLLVSVLLVAVVGLSICSASINKKQAQLNADSK